MGKLHNSEREANKQISLEHTQKILEGSIQMVIYDVNTVYFEAAQEDELRKTGFSKDGKHQATNCVGPFGKQGRLSTSL